MPKASIKQASPGADDLDDGLEYSFEAESDTENPHLPTESELLEQDDNDSSEEQETKPQSQSDNASDNKSSKKRKKKSEKLVLKKKQKTEDMSTQKKQITSYPPDLLSDFIAAKLRKAHPDLSTLELNEMSIDKQHFEETINFTEERELENYPKFVNRFAKHTVDTPKEYVVVLCMSAIRACDVNRALKSVGSTKLIKKNSVKHDKAALKSKDTNIIATTPGRIIKLTNEEIFDPGRVGAIVVDSSYLDPKSHHIWDEKDTIKSLKTLTDGKLSPKIFLY